MDVISLTKTLMLLSLRLAAPEFAMIIVAAPDFSLPSLIANRKILMSPTIWSSWPRLLATCRNRYADL